MNKEKIINNSLSGSEDFIKERDFRFKFIRERGLTSYLCQRVLCAGKPITSRTVRNAFTVNQFEDLANSLLAVWIESEKLINEVLDNERSFGK